MSLWAFAHGVKSEISLDTGYRYIAMCNQPIFYNTANDKLNKLPFLAVLEKAFAKHIQALRYRRKEDPTCQQLFDAYEQVSVKNSCAT